MEKLTKEKAMQAVNRIEIEAIAGDYEAANRAEHNLMYDFISCVAAGLYTHEESVEIANIIKQIDNI